MSQWPERDRPGFVAFHHDYRDGSRGRAEDEAYFDIPKIEEYMRAILTVPGNFFGLIDQFGVTLQFMGNDDRSIRIEIPDPDKKGSLTTDASLDECVSLVRSAGPALAALDIPGVVFEEW